MSTNVRVSVTNESDTGGTFTTPVWVGFHNGSFDVYNRGEVASAGLEQIAEDGDPTTIGAELIAADANAQGGVVLGAAGPIATRETTSGTFTLAAGQTSLSLAAMLLPSNDAFIATGSALNLFDEAGNFLGAQTIEFAGTDVLDAGTEVNTEQDAAFINQTAPNTGIDENGTVQTHPGFNGSLGNPGGDQIILGGTNAFGDFIDPDVADFTLPGAQVATVHVNTFVETEGTSGNDFIRGDANDDIVDAGDGNDVVFGRGGWDDISGGAGNDVLSGGAGNDIIDGGTGNDAITGGTGSDTLLGGDGNDSLRGGSGNDNIDGGTGSDKISGGSGNDSILGGDGNDVIAGGNGNDRIDGGAGGDVIRGGAGDDFLAGGAGNDFIRGGSGTDTILFASGDGTDTISGFRDDLIALQIEGIASFDDLDGAISQAGRNTSIDFGDAGSLLLLRTSADSLSADDFLFL